MFRVTAGSSRGQAWNPGLQAHPSVYRSVCFRPVRTATPASRRALPARLPSCVHLYSHHWCEHLGCQAPCSVWPKGPHRRQTCPSPGRAERGGRPGGSTVLRSSCPRPGFGREACPLALQCSCGQAEAALPCHQLSHRWPPGDPSLLLALLPLPDVGQSATRRCCACAGLWRL